MTIMTTARFRDAYLDHHTLTALGVSATALTNLHAARQSGRTWRDPYPITQKQVRAWRRQPFAERGLGELLRALRRLMRPVRQHEFDERLTEYGYQIYTYTRQSWPVDVLKRMSNQQLTAMLTQMFHFVMYDMYCASFPSEQACDE